MTEEIMEAATPKNTRTATRQPKKQAPVQIGDNVLVRVKSGFYGKLCYRNTITMRRPFGNTLAMSRSCP